ncbi:hypothetical protein [Mycobacterium sp. JS623]|uniref:hypothetical protein n=1 Tax=Mycobacterium sp. JS623 TaxID=212767 RepID=UPI0002D6202E|nr:hypothetical protein [Mycobacterium sp. JS623]
MLGLEEPDSEEFEEFEEFEEAEVPSSAEAIAGLLAIAAPIPSATASPPTLPMKRPYEYGVVATGESFRRASAYRKRLARTVVT